MFLFLIFALFFSFTLASEKYINICCEKNNIISLCTKYIPQELILLLQEPAKKISSAWEKREYSFIGSVKELCSLIHAYNTPENYKSHIKIINYIIMCESMIDKDVYEKFIKIHGTALIDIIKKQNLDVEIIEKIENTEVRNKIKLSLVSLDQWQRILDQNICEIKIDHRKRKPRQVLFHENFLIITTNACYLDSNKKYETFIYDITNQKKIYSFFHKNNLYFSSDKTYLIEDKPGTLDPQIIVNLLTLQSELVGQGEKGIIDICEEINIIQIWKECSLDILFKNKKTNKEICFIPKTLYKYSYNQTYSNYNWDQRGFLFRKNNIFYNIQGIQDFCSIRDIIIDKENARLNFLGRLKKEESTKEILFEYSYMFDKKVYDGIELKNYTLMNVENMENFIKSDLKPLLTLSVGYNFNLIGGNGFFLKYQNSEEQHPISKNYLIKSIHTYNGKFIFTDYENNIGQLNVQQALNQLSVEKSCNIKMPVTTSFIVAYCIYSLYTIILNKYSVLLAMAVVLMRLTTFQYYKYKTNNELSHQRLFNVIGNCFSCQKNNFTKNYCSFCDYFVRYEDSLEKKEWINTRHCQFCSYTPLFLTIVFALDSVRRAYATQEDSCVRFKQMAYYIIKNSIADYKIQGGASTSYHPNHTHHSKNLCWGGWSEMGAKSFLAKSKEIFSTKEDYKEFKKNIIEYTNNRTLENEEELII